MKTASYENPVYSDYFADPFVFRHENTYYAVGTGPRDAAGVVGAQAGATVFPLLRSKDLATWSPVGHALVRPDAALGNTFWAPEVAHHASSFYLYYSVGFEDREHQLRVATSSAPEGPYLDAGALTDTRRCPFAIDPHPFRDRDGRWYLFYARDFLDFGGAGGPRAGTAIVVSELETMTRLSAREDTVVRARFDWQRFLANRTMYGRVFDWHTVEGPCLLDHGGFYYCLYSAGRWQGGNYGVDFAIARDVRGPYDDAGGAHGPRVLKSLPEYALGPGHNSVVIGPDGSTQYVAYHAWDPAFSARRFCIDRLMWTPAGPRCDGPTHARNRVRLREQAD